MRAIRVGTSRSAPHKAGNGVRTITCRNRHCPGCQGAARRKWVAARLEDVLPIPYFHVVFTLPHEINEVGHYRTTAGARGCINYDKQQPQQVMARSHNALRTTAALNGAAMY